MMAKVTQEEDFPNPNKPEHRDELQGHIRKLLENVPREVYNRVNDRVENIREEAELHKEHDREKLADRLEKKAMQLQWEFVKYFRKVGQVIDDIPEENRNIAWASQKEYWDKMFNTIDNYYSQDAPESTVSVILDEFFENMAHRIDRMDELLDRLRWRKKASRYYEEYLDEDLYMKEPRRETEAGFVKQAKYYDKEEIPSVAELIKPKEMTEEDIHELEESEQRELRKLKEMINTREETLEEKEEAIQRLEDRKQDIKDTKDQLIEDYGLDRAGWRWLELWIDDWEERKLNAIDNLIENVEEKYDKKLEGRDVAIQTVKDIYEDLKSGKSYFEETGASKDVAELRETLEAYIENATRQAHPVATKSYGVKGCDAVHMASQIERIKDKLNYDVPRIQNSENINTETRKWLNDLDRNVKNILGEVKNSFGQNCVCSNTAWQKPPKKVLQELHMQPQDFTTDDIELILKKRFHEGLTPDQISTKIEQLINLKEQVQEDVDNLKVKEEVLRPPSFLERAENPNYDPETGEWEWDRKDFTEEELKAAGVFDELSTKQKLKSMMSSPERGGRRPRFTRTRWMRKKKERFLDGVKRKLDEFQALEERAQESGRATPALISELREKAEMAHENKIEAENRGDTEEDVRWQTQWRQLEQIINYVEEYDDEIETISDAIEKCDANKFIDKIEDMTDYCPQNFKQYENNVEGHVGQRVDELCDRDEAVRNSAMKIFGSLCSCGTKSGSQRRSDVGLATQPHEF